MSMAPTRSRPASPAPVWLAAARRGTASANAASEATARMVIPIGAANRLRKCLSSRTARVLSRGDGERGDVILGPDLHIRSGIGGERHERDRVRLVGDL